jgi:predicted DNA-binding transcriptional regulator AlpA
MTMNIDGPLEDISTVLKKFRVKSASTVYRWMQRGDFPQPLRLSCRCVRWRKSETDAVINGTWKPQDQG